MPSTGQSVTGTAAVQGGFDCIDCVGLPANRVVAFPSETVRVTASGTEYLARVIRIAKTDEAGVARIFLDQAVPNGDVLIGFEESVVYEVIEPGASEPMQTASGNISYDFDLLEVFEDETDGFVDVNPWGIF